MIRSTTFAVLTFQHGDDAFTRYAAFLFVLAGVGVIISIWALGRALGRKRTQALEEAAVRMGFTFGGDEWPDKGRAPMLETALFGKGHGHEVKNIAFGGAAGFRASVFDYTFIEGTGRNSQRYTQTVATFSKDRASLPYFELHEASTWDRAWDVVAHKNIHLETAPEFSRRYVLRGALPDKVSELFSPALISFVEGLDTKEKWRIEGTDDTLVVYRIRKKAAPEKLRDFLDQTSAIASGFFSLAAQIVATNTAN